MQVTVDRLQGLERSIKVVLPAERLEQKAHAQLQKMTTQVKLKGFRNKKVPFSEVKKRFATSVYQEIAVEEMKSSLNDVLTQENIFPATTPNIEVGAIQMGEPLVFTAKFEEYPEINLIDFKTLQIDKLVSQVPEEQVDQFVEDLRKQNAEWQDVSRPAVNGDTVVIDFAGTINGEAFTGGSAKAVRIELGRGMMLPDFEKQLLGVTAGQIIDISLTFPENYHKDLGGKQAVFNTVVLNVLEAKLPETDEVLIEKLKFKEGGMPALRAQIIKSIEGQVDDILKQKIKLQVIDKLTELHKVQLPKAMVDQELQRLHSQASQQHHHEHDEHCDHSHDEVNVDEETAERNVKQALLLRQIMKASGLQVDANRVRQHIMKLAQPGQDPQQVLAWFYQDKKRYANIEAAILEEQIVEKVLEQAQLVEKLISYEEAIGAVILPNGGIQ